VLPVERRSKLAARLRLLAFQFRALSTASPITQPAGDENGAGAEREAES
jgi:hypothetical protein